MKTITKAKKFVKNVENCNFDRKTRQIVVACDLTKKKIIQNGGKSATRFGIDAHRA